jgi:hypothetical protein
MSDGILGWKLESEGRDALLARFPPVYQEIVADHVTLGPAAEAPRCRKPIAPW